MYEGRKVNCAVTKVGEDTFNATILGIGVEMVGIPKEKFNPKYCMPDGINTKEKHEQYLKDIGYKKIDDKLYSQLEESLTVHHESGSMTKPYYEDVEDIHDCILEHYNYKELKHFKDNHTGLWAFDKPPMEIFGFFLGHIGEKDASTLIDNQEKLDQEFSEWFEHLTFKIV